MPALLRTLKARLSRRAHYERTLSELRRMDRAVMNDLDLTPEDLPALAHKAVYGA
ncbi:MAG: hypothetical protein KDA50_10225 [Rhodobacteraceae bacterium]|nr:hypothetical protein [Paracoccaceae bacterium]